MGEEVATIIVKTKIDNSGFEKDTVTLKSKMKLVEKRLTAGLGRGLKKAVGLTGKLGKAFVNIVGVVTGLGIGLVAVTGILALLVAGVGILTKAFKKVFQESEGLKTNLSYLKFAFSKAIEPAVNAVAKIIAKVVNWILKAIQYTAFLIKLITGINIFKNASVEEYLKSMQEAQDATAGTAKNVKEIKKQLAGFDEMNVLSDNSGGGAGAETSAIGMPDFDLSDLTNVEAEVEKLKTKWQELGEEMRINLYEMPFSNWTDAFGNWDLAIYGVIQMIHGLWDIVEGFIEMATGLWRMIHGLITGDTEEMKTGASEFFEGLKKIILGFWEFLTGLWNLLVGIVKGVVLTIWNFISDLVNKGIEKIVGAWTTVRNKIKEIITGLKTWLIEHFGAIGIFIGEMIGKSIYSIINGMLTRIESMINGFVSSINLAIGLINKIPGVKLNKLQLVHFPRLAKGGIVNMPSRGVPVGNAIAGERGAEGVIPLTDSQQMALLGEAIGKYITMNATVPVYIGNRLVMREMKRIEAEDNFAYNR